MGDDQHAGAGDVARGSQHVEDLGLHRDVQRGRRFVTDQQVGIIGDRDRDHHPLALTPGQLVRKCPRAGGRLRDADQLEQLDGTLAGIRPADIGVVHLDGFGYLVADGVHGGQG